MLFELIVLDMNVKSRSRDFFSQEFCIAVYLKTKYELSVM